MSEPEDLTPPHPFDDPEAGFMSEPEEITGPVDIPESAAIDGVQVVKLARHEVNSSRDRQQATYKYYITLLHIALLHIGCCILVIVCLLLFIVGHCHP